MSQKKDNRTDYLVMTKLVVHAESIVMLGLGDMRVYVHTEHDQHEVLDHSLPSL